MRFRNLPAGDRERAVQALVMRLWPESRRAAKWNVDDEDAFAEELWSFVLDRVATGSSGEVLSAQFVAQVWRNRELVNLAGAFDLVDAFERWDERHRDILRQWTREPWGA